MEPAGRYRISVHRARGAYYARVAELPGCIARGQSEVEAVENARAAVRSLLLLDALLASDRPVVRVEISP